MFLLEVEDTDVTRYISRTRNHLDTRTDAQPKREWSEAKTDPHQGVMGPSAIAPTV